LQDEADGAAPRLWMPGQRKPGTAFTRSIGDSVAERIGVFAEPEVAVRRLTGHNPFFIVASDGVWEFLTSQSVVDMVSKYEDPHEAATAIAAESYRLWLQNDSRTDDISLVVVHVENIADEPSTMRFPTPYSSQMDLGVRTHLCSQPWPACPASSYPAISSTDTSNPLDYDLPVLSNHHNLEEMGSKKSASTATDSSETQAANARPVLMSEAATLAAELVGVKAALLDLYIFSGMPMHKWRLCLRHMQRRITQPHDVITAQVHLNLAHSLSSHTLTITSWSCTTKCTQLQNELPAS
jgi:hypothetical protein